MFFIVEVENNDWWVWFVGGFSESLLCGFVFGVRLELDCGGRCLNRAENWTFAG